MIPTNLKVIQLTNADGDHAGVYLTERTSLEEIQNDFDVFFEEAIELEDSQDEDWDVHTYVDNKLETRGVYRYIAEEVTTEVI
jgi:hypothetical protein